jgi:uncharacterized C2H2 Zn-finger protein
MERGEARKRKREAEVQSLDERIAKEKEAKIVEDKEKEAKGLIVRCPFCDKVLLPNYLSRHLRKFHLSKEEKEAKKAKNEEEKEAKKAKNEEKEEKKTQKQGREGGEKTQKRGREGSWSYTYGTWRTLVGTVENIYCRLQIFAST